MIEEVVVSYLKDECWNNWFEDFDEPGESYDPEQHIFTDFEHGIRVAQELSLQKEDTLFEVTTKLYSSHGIISFMDSFYLLDGKPLIHSSIEEIEGTLWEIVSKESLAQIQELEGDWPNKLDPL